MYIANIKQGIVVAHNNKRAPASAEWGYFSLAELWRIRHNGLEIGRSLNWKPTSVKDIGLVAYCG